MTRPAARADRPDRRSSIDPVPIAGFSIALVCAVASLGNLRAYVVLTDTTRWGFTDLLLALFALTGCWIVFTARHQPSAIALVLVASSGLSLVAGNVLEVVEDLHGYGDDYLPAIIWMLGNTAMFLSALVGLFLCVAVPRPRGEG